MINASGAQMMAAAIEIRKNFKLMLNLQDQSVSLGGESGDMQSGS
jgi:hypothetical protein